MKACVSLFLFFFFVSDSLAVGLKDMKNWGYQLQSYSKTHLDNIKNSSNTLWVIDYSKQGTEADKFTPNEIQQFKKNNNMIISYFCLGEAEMIRYYWKNLDKSLIIKPNPEFPDNRAQIAYRNSVG